MPATSDSSNQWVPSRRDSGASIPGTLSLGRFAICGDCVPPPPSVPTNATLDRNRVTPSPRMLMATPETMWSTRKVTVATAWTSPPAAPNRTAASTPAHGPYW